MYWKMRMPYTELTYTYVRNFLKNGTEQCCPYFSFRSKKNLCELYYNASEKYSPLHRNKLITLSRVTRKQKHLVVPPTPPSPPLPTQQPTKLFIDNSWAACGQDRQQSFVSKVKGVVLAVMRLQLHRLVIHPPPPPRSPPPSPPPLHFCNKLHTPCHAGFRFLGLCTFTSIFTSENHVFQFFSYIQIYFMQDNFQDK